MANKRAKNIAAATVDAATVAEGEGGPIRDLLPLDALYLADDNVRRGGKADLEQLAADIQAHGVLQNLIAVMDAPAADVPVRFRVVAGGRRLRALQLLARRKAIAADDPVPVMVLGDASAREVSLAENYQRLPMDPIHEAEAFGRVLEESGFEPKDVAARFGVTERYVNQRLRLAGLAPAVIDALRKGKIGLAAAEAFASVPDQEVQAAVLKRASDWQLGNPASIRREMQGEAATAACPKALYVGREPYEAAGGRFDRDLFTDDADELWTDRALLDRLADARLIEDAELLRQQHGFAAVLPDRSWPSNQEAVGDLVRFDQSWMDFTGLPDEVRAQLIVIAAIDGDGEVTICRRYAWLNDASVPVVVAPTDAEEDDAPASEPQPETEPEESGDKPLSQALLGALAMRRRDALAVVLAGDQGTAQELAWFWLADSIGRPFSDASGSVNIQCGEFYLHEPVKDAPWAGDALHLAGQADDWDDSWRHLSDLTERWEAFRALTGAEKAEWGALGLAATLQPVMMSRWPDGKPHFHDAIAEALGGVDAAALGWRPTAENYFDRAGKARCIAMLRDVFDGRPDVAAWAKWKKGELASACEALARGDSSKLGGLGGVGCATIKANGRRWLPPEMRFRPVHPDPLQGLEEPETDTDEALAEAAE